METTESLVRALRDFIESERFLLEHDLNERTITHRLALYLGNYFSGWDVDCEYNRNHEDIKRLQICRREIDSSDTWGVTVYPDIIVHRRKTNDNLLVIEVKKSSSRISDDNDIKKLNAFKEQLGYKYAAFVKFRIGGQPTEPDVHWV